MNAALYVLALLALVACAAQTHARPIDWGNVDYGDVEINTKPLNSDR